ncbi:zinc-dependent alcohol dehydrogenase [Patulibacter medicamentivorans]|uniref:zinc-dependent alcohol dehydrogenase n=1 Tax=Patulibacter medicamentivorans TaxID=1097667 RepID=UPI0009D92A68|nr:alcohol dehydrogenase catalytic domain-containing protein [Patulibacter medicamentivorans]
MRAVQVTGLGTAELREVPEPRPEQGEVVIRPTTVGICGTDVHVLHHGALIDPDELPLTLGHEFVGEIVEVAGPPQRSQYPALGRLLAPGARVTVEPLVPCGSCLACRRGRPNRCGRMSHLGIWRDGAMADAVSAPVGRVVPVPDALDDTQAALIELYACAVNFVDQGRVEAGAHVAVVGAGPVGLATAQCALAAGAATVTLVDPQASRRRFAAAIGLGEASPDAAAARAALDELTGGQGASVVFECVGAGPAIDDALSLAAVGGRVVAAGIPTGAVTLDWNVVVTRELAVVGAFASSWSFARTIDLMAAGRLDAAALVTARVPLDDAVHALNDTARDPRHCKVHLQVA